MERYLLALEKAKKEIKVADHILNVTYRLVKDPKLILAVVERLRECLVYTIAAILLYERYYKRIPPFKEDFEVMFSLFKARCTRRYHINIEYISLIQDVKDIVEKHKQSAVEFTRGEKLVICNDSFRTYVLTIDKIKNYINKAKLFVKEASNMVSASGRSI